jgi:hypothetical protein
MNGKRIGVFHSPGRNFGEVLRAVRQAFPEGDIAAIVPRGFSIPTVDKSLCNAVIEMSQTTFSLRRPGSLFALVRQLRAERYDSFVIMFDSPRLRMFAGTLGARATLYYTFDRRLRPVKGGTAGAAAMAAVNRIRGQAVYMCIWLLVRLLRAERG